MSRESKKMRQKMMSEKSSSSLTFDYFITDDLVDDEDDCIICYKLLLNHSEKEANECYSTLTKRQIFRKKLAKKQLEVP